MAIKTKRLVPTSIYKKKCLRKFSSYSHWKKDGNAKQTYVLEKHAQRAAESMEKRYGHKYKVYRCMFCNRFHIGKPLKTINER
jgi:hypothetical protein